MTVEQNITKCCIQYNIENYSINPDGSIDVDGDVNLQKMDLDQLPLKFKNVSGNFNCKNNKLTTLTGSPKSVGGNFNCSINYLVSLVDGPLKVQGNKIV